MGTLLWKGVRVSVENSAAIRKAVDKGVEFVICTGRGVFGVEKHLQELHLLGKKGYVICQNGAAVYDLRDMHLVLKRSFSPSVVQPIAERARALGLELFYYDDRNFMIEKLTDEVKSYCWMMQANPQHFAGADRLCGRVYKMLNQRRAEKSFGAEALCGENGRRYL